LKLYFGGSEIPSHRKVLREVGAKNASLSYMGLRRRIKHTDAWLLEEKFPEDMHLLLDSGAYTVNKAGDLHSHEELEAISDEYQQYVMLNYERCDAVIEFDALPLGREWIEAQREDFYDELDPEHFIPIWHPEWGLEYLEEMAEKYANVGIPTTDLSGRNLTPVLNRLALNTRLHGVSMTQMDEMRSINWHSVSSTSWVSPQQYGDTIVWTGRELKRYPKKSKDQARKRYRTLFEREGFDNEKITNDDSTELLRLSIWSWERFVEDIEDKAHRGANVVTTDPDEVPEGFAEVGGEVVDTRTGEVGKSVTTPAITKSRPTTALPVLGVTSRMEPDVETGEDREVTDVRLRSDSQRKCDTCFLAAKCPAFDPGNNCAYDIPLQIKSRTEFTSLFNSMLEMQAQRVVFMRFAEEIEGGYADPNLSAEVDRLTKMMKAKVDMEQEGFTLKIDAKQTGGGTGGQGVLSRLFGDQAAQKAAELPAPIRVESALETIEAEIVQ
jgi:hypothetical protein